MTEAQIENIFTYHAPVGDQTARYAELRAKGQELALLVNKICPDSREKSVAITYIQQAIQMANASIAITETKPAEPAAGR
jgi:hypothetical protein